MEELTNEITNKQTHGPKKKHNAIKWVQQYFHWIYKGMTLLVTFHFLRIFSIKILVFDIDCYIQIVAIKWYWQGSLTQYTWITFKLIQIVNILPCLTKIGYYAKEDENKFEKFCFDIFFFGFFLSYSFHIYLTSEIQDNTWTSR